MIFITTESQEFHREIIFSFPFIPSVLSSRRPKGGRRVVEDLSENLEYIHFVILFMFPRSFASLWMTIKREITPCNSVFSVVRTKNSRNHFRCDYGSKGRGYFYVLPRPDLVRVPGPVQIISLLVLNGISKFFPDPILFFLNYGACRN